MTHDAHSGHTRPRKPSQRRDHPDGATASQAAPDAQDGA